MKILIACELPEAAIENLRTLASEVDYAPRATADSLRTQVADAAVLIVGSTRISPDTIARGTMLQLIVHAGAGSGNIAIDNASEQGIFVAHCPHARATAIAEMALALLAALDRRIVECTLALREGRWERASAARGLAGRTIGLLGYGEIGRLLAARASALGMRIAVWTPALTTESIENDEIVLVNWPRELARRSDFVVVLPAADGDGRPLVDAEFLENMPAGGALIHVGLPGSVDEAALAEAIGRRNLRAALDVFNSEPGGDSARFRSKLLELPGVIATPHLATLTEQARDATAEEVVQIVRTYLVSGEVQNCLNLAERSPATWQLVLRVRDQVGVMASILEAIRADGINAEEIISRVFTGAKAAWISIALDERPSTEALESVRALPGVLHLELRAVM